MPLITTVSKDGLNFIFFLVLRVGVNIVSIFGFRIILIFFKILDIIDVVGDLPASA